MDSPSSIPGHQRQLVQRLGGSARGQCRQRQRPAAGHVRRNPGRRPQLSTAAADPPAAATTAPAGPTARGAGHRICRRELQQQTALTGGDHRRNDRRRFASELGQHAAEKYEGEIGGGRRDGRLRCRTGQPECHRWG